MPRGTIARKNVRCSREVAFLLAQSTSYIVVTDETVNSPTASTVVATSLERQAELERSFDSLGKAIDYNSIMSPSANEFAKTAGLPSPRSISGRFLLSLSGANLIRALDLDCASLTTVFECAVRPEFAIRLALRILLLSAQGEDAVPTLPIDVE